MAKAPQILWEVIHLPEVKNHWLEMRKLDQLDDVLCNLLRETGSSLDQHQFDLQLDPTLQSEVATLCPTQPDHILRIQANRQILDNKVQTGQPGAEAILHVGSEGQGKSSVANALVEFATADDRELKKRNGAAGAPRADDSHPQTYLPDLLASFQLEPEEGLEIECSIRRSEEAEEVAAREEMFSDDTRSDAKTWEDTKNFVTKHFSRMFSNLVGILPTSNRGISVTTVSTIIHLDTARVDFMVRLRYMSCSAVREEIIHKLNKECLAYDDEEERKQALRDHLLLVQAAASMLAMEYDKTRRLDEEGLIQRFAQRRTLDNCIPRRFEQKLGGEVELRMRTTSRVSGLKFVKQTLLLFTTGPSSHWGLLDEVHVYIPATVDEELIDVPGFNLAKPGRHALAVKTMSEKYANATALIFGGVRGLTHDTMDGLKSSGLFHKLLQEPHQHAVILTLFLDQVKSEELQAVNCWGQQDKGTKKMREDERESMANDFCESVDITLEELRQTMQDGLAHAKRCVDGTGGDVAGQRGTPQVSTMGAFLHNPHWDELTEKYGAKQLWANIHEARALLRQRHDEDNSQELIQRVAMPYFANINEIGEIGFLLNGAPPDPSEPWSHRKEQEVREVTEEKLQACLDEVLDPGDACMAFFDKYIKPLVDGCRRDEVMARYDSETFFCYSKARSTHLGLQLKLFNSQTRSPKACEASLLLLLCFGDLHTELCTVVSTNLQAFVYERYIRPLKTKLLELLNDVFQVPEEGEVGAFMTSSEEGRTEAVILLAKQYSFREVLEGLSNDALRCLDPVKVSKEVRKVYHQEIQKTMGGKGNGAPGPFVQIFKEHRRRASSNRARAEDIAECAYEHAVHISNSVLDRTFKRLVVSEGVFPSLTVALSELLRQTCSDWNRIRDGERVAMQNMELPVKAQYRACELASRLVAAAVARPKLWEHFQPEQLIALRDCIQRGHMDKRSLGEGKRPPCANLPPVKKRNQEKMEQRQARLLKILQDRPENLSFLAVTEMVGILARDQDKGQDQRARAKLRAEVHRDLDALEKSGYITKTRLGRRLLCKAVPCRDMQDLLQPSTDNGANLHREEVAAASTSVSDEMMQTTST